MLGSPADRCVLIAERNQHLVGMVTAQLVVSTAEGGLSAWIEDMVVAEEFRRKGIGCTLLDAMSAWAAEHGATRLQLLADRTNEPALRFYERMGWRQTRLVCLRKGGA